MKNILILLFMLILISCREQDGTISAEDKVLSAELPQGFHEFYDRFHSDSSYQLAHVVFPLKGSITRKDSMETITLDKEFEPENWTLHKPFNPNAGYNRSFTVMGDLVLENIQDNMGLFTIERRWGKVDTTWSLIYYGTIEKSW